MRKGSDALVWRFKKEEIASILDRMERLKTLVQITLQMDHFKLSQAIKDDSGFIRTQVSTINSTIDTIRQDQDDARHGKLMDWISPTNFPVQQSDFIGRRQEGTGQWFLDAPELAGWLRHPKEVLFCPGIPGAGKTMIAAIAVDYLLKTVQSSSVGVAYLYCNYKAQKEQDTTALLAAILKQLVQVRPSLIEPVERMHQQHFNRGTRPTADEILVALQSVLARFSTVHVVIDALDECRDSDGTRRLFLAKLRDLQAKTDVRLMVTSRFIPDIVNEFDKALRLEVQASNEDVRRFVAGQVYRLPRCIQRDTALQDMVQSKIEEAVDGMFLLARLHTDSLLDKRTPKDVKSTLAKLSKGSLEDAYEEAIQRIEGQLSGDYERAKKVLSWITYAQRPLTTAEICCALAVEPEKEELDSENIPDVEDLVSVCAGLVVVDHESTIIRLVHYTTQEYFERIREQWNPSAQLGIASTCLTYLSFRAFSRGSCSTDKEFEDMVRRSEFLDYAAKYWGQHTLTVQDKVYELACSFLLRSGSISCVAQIIAVPDSKYRNYSQNYPSNTTGLHLTARFGLPRVSQELLARVGEEIVIVVNAKDSRDQTPLFLAAEHGHHETVKLFLDKGADINAQGGEYGNALQAASYRGHEQVVKLLLSKNVDVNAQGGDYGSALQEASAGGHEQIVKLLLDKNVDINAQGGRYGSALQEASAGGHEQIVKLLLDKDADVNAQGGDYGNALQAASYEGHEQIVKLLVDKGANVNAQGGPYGSFLNLLAFKGHTSLLRMVYEHNHAMRNLLDSHGRTALQLAASGGKLDAFDYLIRLGLDLNIEDAKGDRLLHYASLGGSLQILNALFDKDLISSSQSGRWSPLYWACRSGNPNVVERLIREGLRSECITIPQPEGQWDPVSIAIFHGNRTMLDKLSASCRTALDTGADAVRLQGRRQGDYWCNGCCHDIYGPRFHCRICPDFDYCFMCKPFLDHLHENHEWDCVEA
ncbi:ankyrin repeat domain-containing protein [Phaeosphaeriaceae sp. PMI808]|nr:ankyrin repeat domain-containing protein [Phaeosphaeriaceae sp. PMI808]